MTYREIWELPIRPEVSKLLEYDLVDARHIAATEDIVLVHQTNIRRSNSTNSKREGQLSSPE